MSVLVLLTGILPAAQARGFFDRFRHPATTTDERTPEKTLDRRSSTTNPAAASPSAVAKVLEITGIQVDPTGKTIHVQAAHVFAGTSARHYSMIKLPSPLRMVVDIPDATLTLPSSLMNKHDSNQTVATIPVHQNGIREIELSQTESPFYRAVHLVVYVEDSKTLWALNTSLQDDQMLLSLVPPENKPTISSKQPLPNLPPTDMMRALERKLPQNLDKQDNPLPSTVGRQVIEAISFQDNHLELKAANGSTLQVKNRFTLSHPSRLVVDIENAVVASKDLLKKDLLKTGTPSPASANASINAPIKQIRVGQFDDRTVRIVIETNQPELVQAVYPGVDKHIMSLGVNTDATVASLPADAAPGQLQTIVVGKRDGDSVIRLTSNTPIVHRLTRQGNQVTLELLNVAAQPNVIDFDKTAFSELDAVKTDTLAAGQPNSKVLVTLKTPDGKTASSVDVDTQLSYDGKTLDLVMMPEAPLLSMGQGTKAPFPARIVIDAGHGGKDLGANRDGIYEKDLNLQVLQYLKQELQKRGFKVYTTRSTDVFLPLPQISAITNDIHPDLFISVHQNASVNEGLNGIETYYYTPQSVGLANKVHQKMINYVGAPDRGVRRAMFYVIHHTAVPAILCEVGYISNPTERRELQSRTRQQKTAFAISEGVVEYLKSKLSAQARAR